MIRFFRSLQQVERGQMLIPSALIIFVFVCLCIPPIFSFMNTGIITAKNTGLHTQEIYAAEAGVYDSIWKIIMIDTGVPKGIFDPPLQYSIEGGVNDKQVNVTVSRHNSLNFHINSIATDPDTGHVSIVDADVAIIGVSGLTAAFRSFKCYK